MRRGGGGGEYNKIFLERVGLPVSIYSMAPVVIVVVNFIYVSRENIAHSTNWEHTG